MNKVFVVQSPAIRHEGRWVERDVSDAASFGKIIKLLRPGNIAPKNMQKAINTIISKMEEYNSNDYILLAGDPIAISFTVSLAYKKNASPVKVLKWDKFLQKYLEYTLPII